MTKHYTKKNPLFFKKSVRLAGLSLCVAGFIMLGYFLLPLLSFHLYLQPVFASQKIAAPIPNDSVLTESSFKDLIRATTDSLQGVDYTNAKNWYPSIQHAQTNIAVTNYLLSIPKLNILDAYVSTVDNNLSEHLVQYGGTAVPPSKGTAAIFGHSTLPQRYKEGDYNTIFAHAHTLEIGDDIHLTVDKLKYSYKIYNITITSPLDTSFFEQNYDDNYLVLITCTPPGTTWRRLLIKARLVHPGQTP